MKTNLMDLRIRTFESGNYATYILFYNSCRRQICFGKTETTVSKYPVDDITIPYLLTSRNTTYTDIKATKHATLDNVTFADIIIAFINSYDVDVLSVSYRSITIKFGYVDENKNAVAFDQIRAYVTSGSYHEDMVQTIAHSFLFNISVDMIKSDELKNTLNEMFIILLNDFNALIA